MSSLRVGLHRYHSYWPTYKVDSVITHAGGGKQQQLQLPFILGAWGSVVAKALCYKPEGRWFQTRWGECIFFNVHNPSGLTRPWGLLSLTEMSTRSRKIMFLRSRARPVRRADNLTAICVDCRDSVGSLISHNPIGLQCLLRRWIYFNYHSF
jgi:hypothetical protein